MPARILVDLLGFTGKRGGTETYARELCTRLPSRLPGGSLVALTNRAGAERVRAFFPGDVHTVSWVGEGRAAWALGEALAVNSAAKRLNAGLVWSPANFGPIFHGVKRVVTVHDTIYHDVPGETRDRAMRAITSWLVTRSAVSADLVITASEAASRSIQSHMRVSPERIRIVPHGTSDPQPPADPWAALSELPLERGRPLMLSTGNRLPHKNFEGLLRAMAAIAREHRPMLVLTGSHGQDPLRPLVSHLGLDADVLLLGWVTNEQLEALYAVADLYVCPSLVEGFGLPVVDAMRRGCLVLANDVPVLREVGGTAALYADAASPGAFAAAIEQALRESPDPARRAAGLAWASGFTWDSAADGTAGVLRAALAGGRADNPHA